MFSNTSFGGGSSTFGTPATSQPKVAFGAFGNTTTTSAPTSFSSFGTGFTSTAPTSAFGTTTSTGFGTGSFGSGFGAAASAAPTFGSGFGTTSTAAPTFGSGFGTASSAAPTFGTGFGTTSTAAPTFGSGFGINASAAPTFGSAFGTTSTAASTFGSGFGTTSTAAPTFGFNPPATTTQSLFSGFGQNSTTSTGGFSGFGQKPFGNATPTTFSGFGTGATTFGSGSSFGQGFGQQAQTQQQPAVAPSPDEALLASIYKCNIFGDERDQVIGEWNALQAFWGTGKGYYAQNATPLEYTPQNTFCRLNTVAYSMKPKIISSEALVAISINKKPEEIRNQQLQFESSVSTILGNKPNVTVHVDRVTPVSDSKSLVLIYIQEKQTNGFSRRIPSTEVSAFLLQPMQKQQLMSLGIDNVFAFVGLTESHLNEYLENAPAGIDPRLWNQAQLENPDKDRFIPTPVIGFNGILLRAKYQEDQVKLHEALLDNLSEDISSMQRAQVATNVKLNELKQKTLELEHRVLKLIVKVSRTGAERALPFGPEEERMKSRLESLESTFNKPQGIKDRLSQIITSLRMHDVSNEKRYECEVDDNMISDLKEFLAAEQKAISELKDVLQTDIADMKLMEEDMNKFHAIGTA